MLKETYEVMKITKTDSKIEKVSSKNQTNKNIESMRECQLCDGTGTSGFGSIDDPCRYCLGLGFIEE